MIVAAVNTMALFVSSSGSSSSHMGGLRCLRLDLELPFLSFTLAGEVEDVMLVCAALT